MPDYVTPSGFTEDIPNREKVGGPQRSFESFIFDTQRDSVYKIITSNIPGIKDLPDYVKDYPKELEQRTKRNEDRKVVIRNLYWSGDGKNAVVVINAEDNKDRWLMKLDPVTGSLSLLDREHNDAWVRRWPGANNLGWVDNIVHIFIFSPRPAAIRIFM